MFSTGAINAEIGFMLHDMAEADLSKAVAARAQTRIVLADSGKFGRRAPIAVSDQGGIDILITDRPPPEPVREMLQNHEISLVLADGEQQ